MIALNTYGIYRLAACVYELRRAGFMVGTDLKKDATGHQYAYYSMKKREKAA